MSDSMKVNNRKSFVSAAVLSCIALLFVSGCSPSPAPPPPLPESAPVAPVPPPRPLVTQAQFEKLLYDTPYADVVEFLGMEPSRQESTYNEGVDGYTRPSLVAWYIWENPDGSFMRLGFTKKLLTEKQSDGLPAR